MAVTAQDKALAAEALNRFPDLAPITRRVGIELINRVDRKTGTAWPSEASIAEALDVTTRAIRKAKTQLRAHGFLTWHQRGRHRTPLYQLAWERLKTVAADIKARVSKAAKPYRKVTPASEKNLGRNKRSSYLTQLKFIRLGKVGNGIQPCKTQPIQNPTLLQQRASARLWDALRTLPPQILSAITPELEAEAVKAERYAPGTGLKKLMDRLVTGQEQVAVS